MRQASSFQFQPFSKRQVQVMTWHLSPHQKDSILICDGAIRSGKTVACILGFISWSMASYKGKNFIVASQSLGSLKRNVLSLMFDMLTSLGISYSYHASESYVEFGGNTYYCYGAPNEDSQNAVQGLTAAGALLDEITLLPESFVNQVLGRCSVDGARVYACCNPVSPMHYIKTEWIDKALEKGITHLHFVMDDNLTLSEERKQYYRNRWQSGVFYERYILGRWTLAEGLIYPHFNHQTMVVDTLPKMRQYWIGIDAGTQNATVYLLCGLGEDGKLYVIREYYHSGRDKGQMAPSEYSKAYQTWLGGDRPQNIFYDPSAAWLAQQFFSDGINGLTKAQNDVKQGIGIVSSLIASNLLRVHRSCTHLLDELRLYSWDAKAQQRGEDAPLKINDHCADALRYVCNSTRHIWQEKLRGGI